MIDHISLAVRDLAGATAFYEAVLSPIGLTRLETRTTTVGFGKRYPEFWLNHRPTMTPRPENSGVHVCIRASDAGAVDAFHRAALAAGGRSEGPPGLRPAYGKGYYAAFVCDLDGNTVEAVTFLAAPA